MWSVKGYESSNFTAKPPKTGFNLQREKRKQISTQLNRKKENALSSLVSWGGTLKPNHIAGQRAPTLSWRPPWFFHWMKKEGRLLRLLGCTKKKKTILDGPTQPTLSLPSNIHELGSGKRGNLQDLLFLKSAQMGFSADRLFNREASVHQLLGGGIVADVILWRQRNLTVGVLSLVISVWVVFERSGYTLLSFCSSVLLLLLSILFVWAKAAALLNRPAPPLPELWLSEEQVNEVAALVRDRLNALLATSQAIALGKDSSLYLKSAAWLLLISVVSAWADLVTLGYACIVVLLTVPALYEKYEDRVDHCVISIHRSICRLYIKLDEQIAVIRKWDLEKLKLD